MTAINRMQELISELKNSLNDMSIRLAFGDEQINIKDQLLEEYRDRYEEYRNKEKQMEKTKPLLADAQIGDLLKLKDGRYIQVEKKQFEGIQKALRNRYIQVEKKQFEGIQKALRNIETVCYYKNVEVIDREPLALKGTAEWAWQMAKLGKPTECKSKHSHIRIRITEAHPNGFIELCDGAFAWALPNSRPIDAIMIIKDKASPTGWQIYEPKSEPVVEPTEKVTDYNVGDWVEIKRDTGIVHVKIERLCSDGIISQYGILDLYCNILRKLKPSEVIVDFGAFRGTLKLCENENLCPNGKMPNPCHFIVTDPISGSWSLVYVKMLKPETRRIVEDLLCAIEKEGEE